MGGTGAIIELSRIKFKKIIKIMIDLIFLPAFVLVQMGQIDDLSFLFVYKSQINYKYI